MHKIWPNIINTTVNCKQMNAKSVSGFHRLINVADAHLKLTNFGNYSDSQYPAHQKILSRYHRLNLKIQFMETSVNVHQLYLADQTKTRKKQLNCN